MAEEAGKILELLSIENVAESYRVIREMQPADLLKRLEDEKISTRGHMPELRARLLRFQVRQCHPHVDVPWYPEDEDEEEKEEVYEEVKEDVYEEVYEEEKVDVYEEIYEEEKEDVYKVEVVEEDSMIKSLADKVEFLQHELEKFKIQYEEEKRDDTDTSESGESSDEEEDNTPTNSDGELLNELDAEIDSKPAADDDEEIPDLLDDDEEVPDMLDEDFAEIVCEKQADNPDEFDDETQSESSGQYDWIEKECEKIVENPSTCVPPTQNHTVKKNAPIPQPTWPHWRAKQPNTVYQPKYQYYPNPESMMTPEQRTYYANLARISSQYYMPPTVQPYWL